MNKSVKMYIIQFVVICLCNYIAEVEPIASDGAKAVEENEFPSFASLITVLPKFRVYCSGTIITGKLVLTTANCLTRYPVGDSWVFVGSNKFLESQKYEVAKWINYCTWAGERKRACQPGDPDIGIVKVQRQMHFDSSVTLALMPLEPKPLPTDGKEVSLMGWPSQYGSKEMNLLTRKVKIDKNKCLKYTYEPLRTLVGDGKLFCSEPGIPIYKHDEGGPVILKRNVLVGINYWRSVSVKAPKVNVHIDLSYYKDFIDYTTSNDF